MFWLNAAAISLLFSHFTAGILLSPGEVCSGERATFHCSKISNSTLWRYSGSQVGQLYIWQSDGAMVTTTLSGIVFTVIREDRGNANEVASTLSFVTNLDMDEKVISCTGDEDIDSIVFHVITDATPPTVSYLDIVDVSNENAFTTLTIEWLISNGRKISAIQVLPLPVSLHTPQESISHIITANITLLYNVNYTFTITAVNCAGESSKHLDLLRGNCSVPDLAAGMILLPFQDTTEGAALFFSCGPQTEAICTRTGDSLSWLPNPAAYRCSTVTCAPPQTIPYGSVKKNAYVEGEKVSFLCQSGQVLNATCSKSDWGGGTWKPNPELLNCDIKSRGRVVVQDNSSVIYGLVSFVVGTLFGAVFGVCILVVYFYYQKTIKRLPSSHHSLAEVAGSGNKPSLHDPSPVAGGREKINELPADPPFAGLVTRVVQGIHGSPPVAGSGIKDTQFQSAAPPIACSDTKDNQLQFVDPPVAGSVTNDELSSLDISPSNELYEPETTESLPQSRSCNYMYELS